MSSTKRQKVAFLLALAQAAEAQANAARGLAELEEREGAREAGEGFWSSHHLPPDVASRAAFAVACRKIPAAELRGKVWTVTREAWAEARATKRTPRKAPPQSGTDLLAELGLEVAGGRR